MPIATACLPVDELLCAIRELSRAGRWETAALLLESLSVTDPDARARVALTAAEVALEHDWFSGTDTAAERVAVAVAEKETHTTPGGAWDLEFVRLRHDYARLLLVDGTLRFGPVGKDPEALAALRRRARALRDGAPDDRRRGWAALYLGLITDNHFAERTAAPVHYEAALRAGEAGADDLLAREALRHLGDHDHDCGDRTRALDRWRRATALGARAGTVPGTLSQQLLLAVLARDSGDEPAAQALATEVTRWAEAIGATRLAQQASAFLGGTDPTAPPQDR
ncbi:hypothetical protein ABZ725_06250 [Streptomyces sp. NPDC006872]|uniref:hypothetical protein n=1 Tax=Streptomyces sp. NPDC006872 TaxID=3155720 RepID=UPI0033CC10C5